MIAALGVVGVTVIVLGLLAYVSDGLEWLNSRKDRQSFRSRWDKPDDRAGS